MMSPVLALALASCVLAQAIPPLTDAQKTQLATAGDYTRVLDEGALYPLLRNAVAWAPGDESGAMIPDYKAIRENPSKHRGDLFLIEGAFQRAISAGKYARPGPWDGVAQQWVIKWGQGFEDVVVVELVAPPPPKQMPYFEQRVRLVARFYKVWNEKDQTGREASFLIFIGQTGRAVGGPGSRQTSGSGTLLAWPMVGLVVAVGLGIYMVKRLRRTARGKPIRPSEVLRQKRLEREGPDWTTDEDQDTSDLPEDPVDALAELHRRQGRDLS